MQTFAASSVDASAAASSRFGAFNVSDWNVTALLSYGLNVTHLQEIPQAARLSYILQTVPFDKLLAAINNSTLRETAQCYYDAFGSMLNQNKQGDQSTYFLPYDQVRFLSHFYYPMLGILELNLIELLRLGIRGDRGGGFAAIGFL